MRLKLAEPKSRLLARGKGCPSAVSVSAGAAARVLGATKRWFERRRYALFACREVARLGVSVFAWYQFSREGNAAGLRRAYVRWPLAARLKRRQRRTSRVLRGGSWNNNPTNLRSAYRNNNTPDNRNNNVGFRVVRVGVSARKVPNRTKTGAVPAGQSAWPAGAKRPPKPVRLRPGEAGEKTRRRAVAGRLRSRESRPALPNTS